MENIELRFNSTALFNDENGEMTISGYINQTEQYSHILGQRKKFREKIKKGAFQRALEKATNINLLYEHNPKAILSSTKGGHMDLEEDERGLKITARIIPTSLGKDVHQLIKAKVVNGCSFGFRMLKDSWKKGNDGIFLRTIEDLELFEVTVCENGAYPQALVSARNLNIVEDVEIPDDIDDIDDSIVEEVEANEEAETVDIEERADKTEELLSVITELLKQNSELIQNLKEQKEKQEDVIVNQPNDVDNEAIDDKGLAETSAEEVVEDEQENESVITTELVTNEEKEEEETTEETTQSAETEAVKETEEVKAEEEKTVDLTAYKNVLNSIKKENLDEN